MKRIIATPEAGRVQQGFTLIELMVVVVIVAILAAVAYPSYMQYTMKANRSAAQSHLLSVANIQERYMLDARQYFSIPVAAGCTNPPTPPTAAEVGVMPPNEVSKNYTIAICANSAATPPSYLITATPIGGQLTNDTACGNLTLTQAAVKGISGTGTVVTCW